MTPDRNDLWFLSLGGTGEIGMNLNAGSLIVRMKSSKFQ